jgi:outer membrane protein assembly factor BamB
VYALNASTGAKLWSYTTGFEVTSSPAVAKGVVYVGSYDGYVYALNASTGVKLWGRKIDPRDSSPAVANGVIYIGSQDNDLYALSAKTGAKLLRYTKGSVSGSSPVVANGVVYIGGASMYAFGLK